MAKYNVLDLFCGCGGLSKGFEMAGYNIVLGVDFNEPALKTYAYNHKGSKTFHGDLFVFYANSNHEKRMPSLSDVFTANNVQADDVVCIESRTENGETTYYITFTKSDLVSLNPSCVTYSLITEDEKNEESHKKHASSLQQIYYGAPGTGKSFSTDDKIKEIYPSKDEQKDNVFRTTFHPDSDYSTFVGAYKPTMVKAKQSQVILDYDSLVDKYKEYIEVKKNMTIASTLMGYDYHDSIVKMQPQHTIGELVADAYKNNTTYDSVLRGGMAVYESNPSAKSDKITYSFVPQTFTKAYIQAWRNYIVGDKKPVFLVIEEINRGNCAQIFGDLFQLLDRDDETGMSCYPIKPDTDLGNHIADKLNDLAGEAPEWQSVIEGEELLLPSNLHIWATMNTSDQSLFPIDSAFKRRWKWEYVKIKNGVDKKTQQPLDWEIKFDHETGTCNHKWWAFVEQINKIIASMTSSADKQLGYFFCKPDKKKDGEEKNNIISEEAFVGKVVFYLWNDVFKNYAMDEGNLFKFKPKPDAKDEDLTFPDFYDEEGKVNGYVAAQFIEHVMTWEKDKED